jgi:hypothetical protein
MKIKNNNKSHLKTTINKNIQTLSAIIKTINYFN